MKIPREDCPVCRESSAQRQLIQIEDMPVFCNVLLPDRESALGAPRGEIHLFFCGHCGHMYNAVFDPSKVEYSPNYENSLHYSPKFQAYAESLAAHLVEKYGVKGKSVIEVGCGKGDFLSLLCRLGGNRGFGFDPSYEGDRVPASDRGDFTVVRDYYSEKYHHLKAGLVACRHVLEHVESPRDFLSSFRKSLDREIDPAVFFEVPNALYTLRDLGIWDLIYEHAHYFTSASLLKLFESSGFSPVSVKPSFGGQYLCIEAFLAEEKASPGEIEHEEIGELAGYAGVFSRQYEEKAGEWEKRLGEWKDQRKKAVVWGGGSKGVTFLNVMKGAAKIEFLVDVNPHKQGLFVPGTAQRVVPPEFLIDYRPDVVIIMNPIYSEEIGKILSDQGIRCQLMAV